MQGFSSLVVPAFLGLVAGIGHGVVSHHAELPLSLTEQLAQPVIEVTLPQD